MPAYPNIAPSWTDPQQASVLDSPAKKAIRALVGLFGGNEPSGQIMGVAGPLGIITQDQVVRRVSPLLEDLFTRNPMAREAYERAQAAQMAEADALLASQAPDVLGGLPTRQVESLGQASQANQALQGLMSGAPRPIPSKTGYETAIPLSTAQPRRPIMPISEVRPGPGRGKRPELYLGPGFESKFSGQGY